MGYFRFRRWSQKGENKKGECVFTWFQRTQLANCNCVKVVIHYTSKTLETFDSIRRLRLANCRARYGKVGRLGEKLARVCFCFQLPNFLLSPSSLEPLSSYLYLAAGWTAGLLATRWSDYFEDKKLLRFLSLSLPLSLFSNYMLVMTEC